MPSWKQTSCRERIRPVSTRRWLLVALTEASMSPSTVSNASLVRQSSPTPVVMHTNARADSQTWWTQLSDQPSA